MCFLNVFYWYNQLWNTVWIHLPKNNELTTCFHKFPIPNSNLSWIFHQVKTSLFHSFIYFHCFHLRNLGLEICESMWWAAHKGWTNYFRIYLILNSNVNWIYCKYTSRQNLLDQIFQIGFNIIFLAIRNKLFKICNNARTVIWVLIFLLWRSIGAKLNQAFFGFHFIPKDFQNIHKKVW